MLGNKCNANEYVTPFYLFDTEHSILYFQELCDVTYETLNV